MQFLFGLLTTVVFICLFLLFFWMGTRYARQSDPKPVDKERQKEIERYDKHFKALFNYDVDKATARKRVT